MKHDLVKIFGEQRAKSIAKYTLTQEEHTILKSTIFTEFDDEPIYMTHVTLPSLSTNYDELKKLLLCSDGVYEVRIEISDINENLLSNFYAEWNPIDYINLVFTDLQPKKVLGDIVLLSPRGVFKLTNVLIDDSEKRMFYDDAILIEPIVENN